MPLSRCSIFFGLSLNVLVGIASHFTHVAVPSLYEGDKINETLLICSNKQTLGYRFAPACSSLPHDLLADQSETRIRRYLADLPKWLAHHSSVRRLPQLLAFFVLIS
jgi:hypothetical protein